MEKGVEPPFSEEIFSKSRRLLHLTTDEERKLSVLRVKSYERTKMEKVAFQLARKARHLSEKEFEEILRQARRLVSKQKEGNDK